MFTAYRNKAGGNHMYFSNMYQDMEKNELWTDIIRQIFIYSTFRFKSVARDSKVWFHLLLLLDEVAMDNIMEVKFTPSCPLIAVQIPNRLRYFLAYTIFQ